MISARIQDRIKLVDDYIARLRCRLLGGNILCLPYPEYTTRAEQQACICTLAAKLTYCYATAYPDTSPMRLREYRQRLLAALTYLLCECLETDQTFGGLMQMLALSPSVFVHLIDGARCTPHRFRHFYRAVKEADAEPFSDSASAVLLYLERAQLLPSLSALRQSFSERR